MTFTDLDTGNKLNKRLLYLQGKLEEIKLFRYENRMNNAKITSVTFNSNTESFNFKRSITLPELYIVYDFNEIEVNIKTEITQIEEHLREL